MKNYIAIVAMLLTTTVLSAKEKCLKNESVELEDVTYSVSKDMPKYLKGAKIVVVLADGTKSEVPAEKFMVVPRKQKTVVGSNKTLNKVILCTNDENETRNLLMVEARKDITDTDSEVDAIPGGVKATTKSNQALVPGVNYFRRKVLDTQFGAGVGVDTNGVVKGILGYEF